MCYNFNVQKIWKFDIILGIHSETVCLFKHFLLLKGTQKILLQNKNIISNKRSFWGKSLQNGDAFICLMWRHMLNEMTSRIYRKIIALKLEYCFTNELYLFWDMLHTYYLIWKVLEFIDHPSYFDKHQKNRAHSLYLHSFYIFIWQIKCDKILYLRRKNINMMVFYRQRNSGKWRHNFTNWCHNISDVQSDWREPTLCDVAWLCYYWNVNFITCR